MEHLRSALAELPPAYAYGALAGILLLEGTGLPLVPFEPLFIATAVLITHGQLRFWPVLLYGAGGDLLGNIIGYRIGSTVGQMVLDRYGPRFRLDAERVAEARSWFWRFGGGTLFIARFFGVIRTPAILIAGLTRMPFTSYVLWCGVADLVWVGAWQLALIRFGRVASVFWQRFGVRAAAAAFGLLVLAAVAVLLWHLRARADRRRPD